jgi:putative hemolysin
MVNVKKHKRCEECDVRASFNYIGKTAMYCFKHNKEGMIDVRSKICKFDGCEMRPSFNYQGKIAMYCEKHKQKGMVNVAHKTCQFEGCHRRVSRAIFCSKHGMNVSIVS